MEILLLKVLIVFLMTNGLLWLWIRIFKWLGILLLVREFTIQEASTLGFVCGASYVSFFLLWYIILGFIFEHALGLI